MVSMSTLVKCQRVGLFISSVTDCGVYAGYHCWVYLVEWHSLNDLSLNDKRVLIFHDKSMRITIKRVSFYTFFQKNHHVTLTNGYHLVHYHKILLTEC